MVEDNPKDFSTWNILGDLYVKNSEEKEAIDCFRQVAEHYNGQGFANKAIAIYNKMAKLQPNSMEVAAKLAQLYQMRGSYAEAREQYTRLAENYQSKGQKIEALAIWKQIAELDPNNTEVYLTIAQSCLQENHLNEAVDSFAEAGLRFIQQGNFEEAVSAFLQGMEVKSDDLKILNGFVQAKIGLGCADEAATSLEEVLVENPYNREILYLLVDCYLDMGAMGKAEQTIIKLVQQEPSTYPKYLDLVKAYLKNIELESAVRVLSIASENLLAGGQAEEFFGYVNEVLARNPENLEGLRLLIRYHSWNRDEREARRAMERMAETARINEAFEEEKNVLAQLVRKYPQEPGYLERLEELKEILGLEDLGIEQISTAEVPEFETFANLNEDADSSADLADGEENYQQYEGDFSIASTGDGVEISADAGLNGSVGEFEFFGQELAYSPGDETIPTANFETFRDQDDDFSQMADSSDPNLKLADKLKLQKEIESIEFYIAQGYTDLAVKCLEAIQDEFGPRPELGEFRQRLGLTEDEPAVSQDTVEILSGEEPVEQIQPDINHSGNVFEQFRSELGLEDLEETEESDYSTHYQMAIAYKEMGLMEEAIKEFQDAISLVEIDDGTRRFFQCANLLGHCFMMQGMPNLAQTWYKRALETADLNDEEIQALNYELASAYEAGGEKEKAFEYFEQVYALDVDYRDISQRMQTLRESYSGV
ncbi:MAG: tetratricopeptide repeat protein [Pyrinomonadaceae bacterium]